MYKLGSGYDYLIKNGYACSKRSDNKYLFFEKHIERCRDEVKKKCIWFSMGYKDVQFSPYIRYSKDEMKAIFELITELNDINWNIKGYSVYKKEKIPKYILEIEKEV